MSNTTSYADWPKKGDKRDQPWDVTDSGVVPRGGLPLLVSGGALGPGQVAQALFTALAELGYDTPISRGENPFGTIGVPELEAVRAFRRDYNVRENPEPFGGDNAHGNAVADSHIGPYTGEAILRAAAAAGAPAETTDDELAALRARVQKLEKADAKKATKPAAKKPAKQPAEKTPAAA